MRTKFVLLTLTLVSEPSFRAKVMKRVVTVGVSEALSYLTERNAAVHWASVAVAPAELRVRMPVFVA